jgi:limonene 1,2-monooxygenase
VVSHTSDWFELHDARLQMLPVNGALPIAVASTTSPSGMVCAGTHGVGVLSLGAGLIGGKKDLAAQWAMGQKAAAAAGRELRREDWRLVIRAHLAETREEAVAAVRAGREHEREHYYRRVAGMKNDTTLEQEIEEDTSIIGTPDDMIAALHRLQDVTGGFGGFMVLANDWASHDATLRSYELIARRVMPELRGHLAPLRASYDMVASNKRSYGGPAVAAIRQAYADAGEVVPDDLSPGKLR